MDHKKYEFDLQRINRALRRGAIERNIRTGLIVAAAASGGLISTSALVVTAGVTIGALCIANNRKTEDHVNDNTASPKNAKGICPKKSE